MKTILIILLCLIAMSRPTDAQVSWWKWPGKWVNSKFRSAKKGKQAPSILGQTLEGQGVTLGDYEGKVLFLAFWAVWCPPCLVEFPHLTELQEAFKDEDLEILAINVFGKKAKMLSYLEKNPLDLNFLYDEGDKVSKAYGIISLPTAILVDETGIVLNKWKGLKDLKVLKSELRLYFKEREKARKANSG